MVPGRADRRRSAALRIFGHSGRPLSDPFISRSLFLSPSRPLSRLSCHLLQRYGLPPLPGARTLSGPSQLPYSTPSRKDGAFCGYAAASCHTPPPARSPPGRGVLVPTSTRGCGFRRTPQYSEFAAYGYAMVPDMNRGRSSAEPQARAGAGRTARASIGPTST